MKHFNVWSRSPTLGAPTTRRPPTQIPHILNIWALLGGACYKTLQYKMIHNLKPTTYNTKSHRYIRPKTFCNKPHINAHLNPPLPYHRTWHILHTLTNPNYQPYKKYKFNGNTTVPYEHLPLETHGTSTDIRMNCRNLTPSNTNGLPPTNNARPMHYTIGRTHLRKKYINRKPEAHPHKKLRKPDKKSNH